MANNMTTKKKFIILIVALCFVIATLATGLIVVIVAYSTKVDSKIKVNYTASAEVSVDASAMFYAGSNYDDMYIDGDTTKGKVLSFRMESDTTGTHEGSLSPVSTISIGHPISTVVLEYKFVNTSVDVYCLIDLSTIDITASSNMAISGYGVSDTKIMNAYNVEPLKDASGNNLTSLPTQVLDPSSAEAMASGEYDSEVYVYIMITATSDTAAAAFEVDFEWNLRLPVKYDIVFDTSNLSNPEDFPVDIAYEGVGYKLPTAIPYHKNAGYTFIAWYRDDDFVNKVVDGTILTGDTTLYPRFEAGNVQLTLKTDSDGDKYFDVTGIGGHSIIASNAETVSPNMAGVSNLVGAVPSGPAVTTVDTLIIPDDAAYNGERIPVKTISNYGIVISKCYNVYMGNNVEEVTVANSGSDNAMMTYPMEYLRLGAGLKTIVSGLFHTGYHEPEIVIPQGVTTIADNAFAGMTNLERVVIPDSVTTIGANAFSGCTSLREAIIPEGVTTIGDNAFSYCSLQAIVIPSTVTSISGSAFANGYFGYLESIEFYATLDSVPNELFLYEAEYNWSMDITLNQWAVNNFYDLIGQYIGYVDTLTIAEGVTTLPDYAFVVRDDDLGVLAYNLHADKVNLPSTLTSVGDSAFHSCSTLESIYIPASVKSIGFYAFANCSSLKLVTFDKDCCDINIGSYAFRNCTSLVNFDFKDSVNVIGGYCFDGCTGLTNVYMTVHNDLLDGPWIVGHEHGNKATLYDIISNSSELAKVFTDGNYFTSEIPDFDNDNINDLYETGLLRDWSWDDM